MPQQNQTIFDCVIIGGGPAGLSAAIYLGRFNRSTLVIDREHGGRWNTHEVNENYLGFPDGIAAQELRERGKRQALKFGATITADDVQSVTAEKGRFFITGKQTTYIAKTILFATGVTDSYPTFEDQDECLGRSLFWCITCDGYKTQGKRVVVVGHTEEAVTTALQFLNYTHQIVFVTNRESGNADISLNSRENLKHNNIPFFEGQISSVDGTDGYISSIHLSTNEVIETDYMFNLQVATPNTGLARLLDVRTDEHGYIITDKEQRTNMTGVYAAGDVTKAFAHQIVTAAHEGAQAAQAINYDLYEPIQRDS